MIVNYIFPYLTINEISSAANACPALGQIVKQYPQDPLDFKLKKGKTGRSLEKIILLLSGETYLGTVEIVIFFLFIVIQYILFLTGKDVHDFKIIFPQSRM